MAYLFRDGLLHMRIGYSGQMGKMSPNSHGTKAPPHSEIVVLSLRCALVHRSYYVQLTLSSRDYKQIPYQINNGEHRVFKIPDLIAI